MWQGSGKVGQVGRACGIAAGFRRRLRMGTGPKGRIAVKQQILVVEDDARIADLIVKNLEAVGYACHASPDGGRALVSRGSAIVKIVPFPGPSLAALIEPP